MIFVIFALLGLGIALNTYRLIVGPGSVDRIVSLDTINIIIVGLIAVCSIYFKNSLILDIGIAYAVLSFLETIVFSRFVEGKYDE